MKFIFTFLYTIFCLSLLKAQPPCIQLSVGNTSCGLNDGSASLYTICCGNISEAVWSNGAQGLSISGLAPGSYEVYAETFDGCGRTILFDILPSDPMPLATTFTNTTCASSNGSATMINLDSLGSFNPYFTWSNGSSQATISNLAAGFYTVTVNELPPSSGEGCVQEFSFDIQPSSAISGSIDVAHTTCNLPNANMTALASGGGSSHTYLWSTGQTTSTIYNLAPNTYSVTIYSSDGCSPLTLSDVAAPSTAISGSVTSSPTTCNLPNGSMEVTASGGGASHTYAWSNGQSTPIISNLAAGSYSVVIQSSDGCTPLTLSGNVDKSSALVVVLDKTETSCGHDNGSLTADANHPNTSYLWNTGATTPSIQNLSPGTYMVTATDDDGCVTSATAVINTSQGFNLSVELEGISLVANTQIFTLYEWIDCFNFTPISGADDKVFTPPSVGSYAVAVYNGGVNGIVCRDTSDCIDYLIAGTHDGIDLHSYITVASMQYDHIELAYDPQISVAHVNIFDVNGVLRNCPTSLLPNKCLIDVSDLPSGLLLVQCNTDKGVITKRVMKI
jgi:hypothetical protein